MKKFLVAMGLVAFAVVGCDDSSSASAGPNDEPGVESSSSVKQGSSNFSSSVDPVSSSSSAKSSSSSSVIPGASEESSSSNSEDKVNCTELLEGETGWSWNVPKECRFNPDIDYGEMTDERDGKAYKTVKIGNQIWMAENLNYYDESNLNVKTKSWCYGKSDNKDSSTCDVAGRLYTWASAIDSAKLYTEKSLDCGYDKTCALPDTVYGICPPGWHLPSKTEWEALIAAVGGESTAGKVLKSQSGWENNGNGSDAFGFSALPTGYRYNDGFFDLDGYYALFWSATEDHRYSAYFMGLHYDVEGAGPNSYNKYGGFSVRCLKD